MNVISSFQGQDHVLLPTFRSMVHNACVGGAESAPLIVWSATGILLNMYKRRSANRSTVKDVELM